MAASIYRSLLQGYYNEESYITRAAIDDEMMRNQKDDELIKSLCATVKSDRFGEKFTSNTALSDFAIVAEGSAPAADAIQEGYGIIVEPVSFKTKYSMTVEFMDDNKLNLDAELKKRGQGLVRAYKRTKAKLVSLAYVNGASTSFTFGTATVNIKGADGVALFSTAHPNKLHSTDTSYNQCNLFTNAFGTTTEVLNKLAVAGSTFKTDSEEMTAAVFDTIMVPANEAGLIDTIKKAIGSEGEIGSDKNDINTQRGKWKLVVNPYWENTSTANKPYILLASELMNDIDGTVLVDRKPLSVDEMTDPDGSFNYIVAAMARFGVGFPNWRHAIMGGAASGKTL